MPRFDSPTAVMHRALELARRGEGYVEPNPMVGAVVVDEHLNLLGEGWHESFGGPHAEVQALHAAGERARGGTLYVTLEPCCHFGKTPPCTRAVIAAGIARVVIACRDPFPQVAGQGIAELTQAGIEVEVGLLAADAERLLAPFLRLTTTGRPYVIAKWAMTADGKIASSTGQSQWISNEVSREVVHRLRGRMDAIIIGVGTAIADDPLLTARPSGPRTPIRIVLDSQARLPIDSQLLRTAADVPVMVATTAAAPAVRQTALQTAGAEVLILPAAPSGQAGLVELLAELGRRRLTNVLVEGGSAVLGSCLDRQVIDEAHVFMAPRLLGGSGAPSPMAGVGIDDPARGVRIEPAEIELLAGDVYLHGPVRYACSEE